MGDILGGVITALLIVSAAVGIEASSWLHLVQDGDPMPRLPRLLRALRPRGRRKRKPKVRR